MSTRTGPKSTPRPQGGSDPIAAWRRAQPPALRDIATSLHALITAALPDATSKVWHGSPVWFIDDNPVVGYSAKAKAISLLFWNGQAFWGTLAAGMAAYAAGIFLINYKPPSDPAARLAPGSSSASPDADDASVKDKE